MSDAGENPDSSGEGAEWLGDTREPLKLLLRDLRATVDGLSARDAARRLLVFGPNQLRRRGGRKWPRALARQLTHPLALLLWFAAGLALVAGSGVLAGAIVGVILLNAVLAFSQEQQAERAVEALSEFLPPQSTVVRDGNEQRVNARDVVPGDVLVIEEGDRVSADAHLFEGSVEVDMSAMTGESLPLLRAADPADVGGHPTAGGRAALAGGALGAQNLVFSGCVCTGGEAKGLVFATGMRTELGRIAALSQRVEQEESPLERQVRRVARLIAAIAVGMAVAFVPVGVLLAGLSLKGAAIFAIGLMVGNVPEGLLPTITLALAIGVRLLARRGALVKRLSAVETLGSTTVICTDKTGTLTENRMQVQEAWTLDGECSLAAPSPPQLSPSGALALLAEASAACSNAHLDLTDPEHSSGDPTELAMLIASARLGADTDSARRERRRRGQFHFDPGIRLMSTVDEGADGSPVVHTKGAPEAVIPRCETVISSGEERALTESTNQRITARVEEYERHGLRVLAVARRRLPAGTAIPDRRDQAERDMCLLGVVAMFDPPRPEVHAAVEACHKAGMRIIVITGDAGLTAAEVAHQVGIGSEPPRIVTGAELEQMSDSDLDRLLDKGEELIFARSSPEAKLRIADALRSLDDTVAMTGDGVNDAPALRAADIGIAMGRSGTDVAREASTMILTDDNFATIVAAVEAGRRVYDNVRKFIFYIFVHAVPEVAPFMIFALSGGLVPAPITPLQVLQIDLLTDTGPALALGREPAEPGIMNRPPRPRAEGVIRRGMLLRAWGFLGVISATLSMAGYFATLLAAGWSPSDPVSAGHPLHHVYLQATTMTFLGIVACQIGTAFAARSERASLRTIGLLTNPTLILAIAIEIVLAVMLVTIPPIQSLFGNAAPTLHQAAILLPFPFIILGADEIRKLIVRRARTPSSP